MSRINVHLSTIISCDKKVPDQEFEGESAATLNDYIDTQALGSEDIAMISLSLTRTVSHYIDYHVKLVIEMPSNPVLINDLLGAETRINDGFDKLMRKKFGNYMLETPWQIDAATFEMETMRRPPVNTTRI